MPLLIRIVELGSFAKAAEALDLTQPTVSHAIKTLEQAVGMDLFVRTSRGIEVTDAGKTLHAFARRISEDVARTERDLALVGDNATANVVVGTKETYAVSLWPGYLAELRRKLPNLNVTLRTSRWNTELLRLLADGHLDLVMLPDTGYSETIVSYEIFRDRFDLYAAPRRQRDLPILAFREGLVGSQARLGQILDGFTIAATSVQAVESYYLAKALALQGLGVALLPESFAEQDVRDGRLTRERLPAVDCAAFGQVPICLAINRKNAKNPTLRAILKAVRGLRR